VGQLREFSTREAAERFRGANMALKHTKEELSGVWSATPTPFDGRMQIDSIAVRRMVLHHLRLGVKGLFLAGTCGEGYWMTDSQRRDLVRCAARFAKGKMHLAVQVTDNSAARILDNIHAAKQDGAEIAIIAPPLFLLNATSENLLNLYQEAIRKSPLPVGIYDKGSYSSLLIPEAVLKVIYVERNVLLVKDSSANPSRRKIALEARAKRPELVLLNGDEFHCVEYLRAGYDGLLLGGGIFNGYLAGQVVQAVQCGDLNRAKRLQEQMNSMMYAVYGGKEIVCWLTGLKQLLVEMKVFRTRNNYLNYPLSAGCRRGIQQLLKTAHASLFPIPS
jgi:4-hydroxy-tetrahydrodipicolinate synthase